MAQYGELTLELTATLMQARTPVAAREQLALRDLLEAMDLPVSQADELEVRGD